MTPEPFITKPDQAKGFPDLRCILCGAEDSLVIQVCDGELHCNECSEDLDADDIRKVLNGYAQLLSWLETIPSASGGD